MSNHKIGRRGLEAYIDFQHDMFLTTRAGDAVELTPDELESIVDIAMEENMLDPLRMEELVQKHLEKP